MKMKLVIGLLIISVLKYTKGSCLGCVELDEITFDKLIQKFEYALIKFDIAFPYGDKHEAFSEFAKSISPKVTELLIGLVGVKDYGEKENSALAKRYNVDDKKFPVILLFKNHSTENWIEFPSKEEITSNNLKKFVKKHSSLYVGLDGCLQILDVLVDKFIHKSHEDQNKIIDKIKEISETLNNEKDKKTSEVYLIIMKRIIEKGPNFIQEEQRRIQNIQNGKIGDNKKKELTIRLNILQSFIPQYDNEVKDEL